MGHPRGRLARMACLVRTPNGGANQAGTGSFKVYPGGRAGRIEPCAVNLRFFIFGAIAVMTLGGCITPPVAPRVNRKDVAKKPDTGPFWWGVASSSFQNEDRAEKPGSPNWFQTDWDLFAEAGRVPPKGEDGVFSWSSFDRDVEALRKIGVNHYRFGVEWARVEPPPGRYNEAALRRYVEMARKLKAAGIEPIVTLWHFTFPSWMVTKGRPGASRWLHPLYRERWPAYVTKVTHAMAPSVRTFAPQNEPNGDLALGYLSSLWPPGMFLAFPRRRGGWEIVGDSFDSVYRSIHHVVGNSLQFFIHKLCALVSLCEMILQWQAGIRGMKGRAETQISAPVGTLLINPLASSSKSSQRSNVSIRVHEHARGRDLRADEGEFARGDAVRKEAFAAAQQDRRDAQHNLVHKSLPEQHGR